MLLILSMNVQFYIILAHRSPFGNAAPFKSAVLLLLNSFLKKGKKTLDNYANHGYNKRVLFEPPV